MTLPIGTKRCWREAQMDRDKGIASKAISYTIPVTKFMMEKLSE